MLNELVLASNYKNTIKFLDTKLDEINANNNNDKRYKVTIDHSDNNYEIKIENLFNALNNVENSTGESDCKQTDSQSDTNNEDYLNSLDKVNNNEISDNSNNTEEKLNIEEEQEISTKTNTSKTSENDSLETKDTYTNNISGPHSTTTQETKNKTENKKHKRFSKQIPIKIKCIPKLSEVNYYSRTPSTSWKSNILSKLYTIVKRMHFSRIENNTKSLIHDKNVIVSSLKEIGISNLGLDVINNKVIEFMTENGMLSSNHVISEKMLRKRLSQYKINKEDTENNMLIFLMIYLVKKLEDEMKHSNIYPSGFKKKDYMNHIINKFNNWNKGEFLVSDQISTNSINKFVDNVRKTNGGQALDTILNLCLCKFTKLN